jgi:rhamnosyltransferase
VAGPEATVIVRAKNAAQTIERTLDAVRSQTVRAEIVIVDSGSTDGTLEIAFRRADRVVQMAPEEFTFGRALNEGARAARGSIHFALSSHCHPEREDWIERSLAHFERPDVAAACGARHFPDGTPLEGVFYQDLEQAREHPDWGFSNHASCWRADVWKRFPFDDHIPAAEDREWSWRILGADLTIAFDPELWVDLSHRWKSAREAYRRGRLEWPALASFAHLKRYGMRELVDEWWHDMPDDRHSPLFHRLNYRRWAELAGKYRGLGVTRSA